MENDERKILDALVEVQKTTNDRIERFTKYILIVLLTVVISFTCMICHLVSSNNATIKECTRLYFETDYLYPETDVIQTQTIGDIE